MAPLPHQPQHLSLKLFGPNFLNEDKEELRSTQQAAQLPAVPPPSPQTRRRRACRGRGKAGSRLMSKQKPTRAPPSQSRSRTKRKVASLASCSTVWSKVMTTTPKSQVPMPSSTSCAIKTNLQTNGNNSYPTTPCLITNAAQQICEAFDNLYSPSVRESTVVKAMLKRFLMRRRIYDLVTERLLVNNEYGCSEEEVYVMGCEIFSGLGF